MIHVRPQLAGPRPADGALCAEIKAVRPRPADLRRPRRRPRAALSHRRLHAAAADARAGRAVDARRRCAPTKAATRLRLRAGRRTARLRRRLQLHAGARPRLRRERRDRRPRLPPRPARRRAAGQEPDARPAAGRHGQLRQAFSRPRLRQGRFAHRRFRSTGAASRPSWRTTPRPTNGSTRTLASRDAGARDLSEGRCPAGRLFQPKWLQRDPARPAGLRRRDLQRRPQHGRRPP